MNIGEITQEDSYIAQGGTKFDLLKFILAILIVILHSGVFPKILLPIIRLAVPLFFMMSSYFFFLKLRNTQSEADKSYNIGCLRRFINRNILLYCFWSIVLIPIVIVRHISWFQAGFWFLIGKILKQFLLSGFFPASWFLVALFYSVIIVFFLAKKLNNIRIILLSAMLYILALLNSNYGGLLSPEAFCLLRPGGINMRFSVPAALIWVSLGKQFAEKPLRIANGILYPLLFMFGVLLYLEFYLVNRLGLSRFSDCFISTIPLCSLVFIAIGQSNDIHLTNALQLRKYSILVYCMHKSLINSLALVSLYCFHISSFVILVITLIVCLLASIMIVYLCEKKNVKILKYAY